MWDAYSNVATDAALATKNHTRVVERLTKTHKFTFTTDESEQLDAVMAAFVAYGPAITTRGAGAAAEAAAHSACRAARLRN